MLTHQRYQASFSTSEERDAFFGNAHRGVAAGTSMKQVLATNIGIWGDERALMRDVAEMMVHEINTWAGENGENLLGVPSTAILGNPLFNEAFNACRKPNRDEIDYLVRSRGSEMESPSDSYQEYLGADFVKRLYKSLCSVADKYANEMKRHDYELARIGAR